MAGEYMNTAHIMEALVADALYTYELECTLDDIVEIKRK